MYKSIIIILLILSLAFKIHSQVRINGIITNESDEALSGVLIKAYSDNKIIGFGRSDKDGVFSFSIKEPPTDTFKITADKIGYEQIERIVTIQAEPIELSMVQSSVKLKEVTVEAPRAKLRGDTISYRLGAFVGESDQTLEDGLKRLPGIEVAESGKISYLGKEISDFYVENLQLTGSRYNLVTKNMPAEYVTNVELIENHQNATMDQGRPSDNVAMNIKLSNKAKFKPIGTAEALAGFRPDDFLYRVNATGMVFSPKFQTLLNIKGGNYNKEMKFSLSNGLPNYPMTAEGLLTGAKPPLSEDTYSYNRDLGFSANFLRAFNTTKTLRVNIGYSNETTRNYYSENSFYSIGEKTVEFTENSNPKTSSHLPYLSVGYILNDPSKYIMNDLNVKGEFTTNDFDVFSNENEYYQHQKIRVLDISDNFIWRKKFGTRSYAFATNFTYQISPTVALNIYSPDNFSSYQNASGHSLIWKGSTSFDLRKGQSIWTIPININFTSSLLKTSLHYPIKVTSNNAFSTETKVGISPSYEMTTQNRKLSVNVAVETNLMSLHIQNKASNQSSSIERLLFNPSFRIAFNPTSRFSLKFNGSINNSTGDILDILTEDIMTDYRTIKTASGIIGERRATSFNLRGEYKDAVNLFFSDASVGYSRTNRNTINSLSIVDQEIERGVIFMDNSSDNLNASTMLSKQFVKTGLLFTIRANYFWSKGHSIQQDQLITSYSQSFSINPSINLKPLRFFELRYNASIGKNFTRFDSNNSGFFSMNNDLKLSIYPTVGWDLFVQSSFIRKEIYKSNYKDFTLLNAGLSWKQKKYKITLKIDNLLNTRNYRYTIYNGINYFSYDFRLTGRCITLKYSLTM